MLDGAESVVSRVKVRAHAAAWGWLAPRAARRGLSPYQGLHKPRPTVPAAYVRSGIHLW